VVHFSGVATAFAIGSLFVFEPIVEAENQSSPWVLLMLLAIGVAATIGQLFLTKAFSAGEPTRVSVVGLTQIVFAMLLDAVLLGKSFNLMRVLGIALVVAPTAWVMLRGQSQPILEEDPEGPPSSVELSAAQLQAKPDYFNRTAVSS
jgi:drug/metabolite transporter (DMT)-like permease